MKEIAETFRTLGVDWAADYFDHQVLDERLLNVVRQRACAFDHMGQAVPLEIEMESICDVGTLSLNTQMIFSLVNLNKSDDLKRFVARKLGYDPAQENTAAAFLFERRFDYQASTELGKPIYRENTMVVVVRISQHGHVSILKITPTAINSTPVRVQKHFGLENIVKELSANPPPTTRLIRGLGSSLFAWNGREWGTVEVADDGNLIARDYTLSISNPISFSPRGMGRELQSTLGQNYGEYFDSSIRVAIPGLAPSPSRGSNIDWFMQMDMPPTKQTPGSVSENIGGGGGGGNTSPSTGGWQFSGTGVCAVSYTSLDSCYSCCDNMALGFVGVTMTVFGGLAAGASGTILGFPAGIVILVAGAVSSAVGGVAMAIHCKDVCNRPRQSRGNSGGGSVPS